jgi:hypothetical protein
VQDYLANHPNVRRQKSPGYLTETTQYYIQVNQLVGVTEDPNAFKWLRENFKPIDAIAPSCLLFEITPEQMQNLCGSTTYCDQK